MQTEQEVKEKIVGFYNKLLGKVIEQIPTINPKIIKEGPILDRDQQLKLIEPIIREKMCAGIDDTKAPG